MTAEISHGVKTPFGLQNFQKGLQNISSPVECVRCTNKLFRKTHVTECTCPGVTPSAGQLGSTAAVIF